MNDRIYTALVIVVVFAAGFTSASVVMSGVPQAPAVQGEGLTGAMIRQLPCMDTAGCVKTDVSVDSSTIYLTQGCYSLAIASNELQTYSISHGIMGTRGPRPTTHDVIYDLIDMFQLDPLIVRIECFSQGTYYATMAFNHGSDVLEMDIRPSDAIAVAVRTETPIYVNETLLEERGQYAC